MLNSRLVISSLSDERQIDIIRELFEKLPDLAFAVPNLESPEQIKNISQTSDLKIGQQMVACSSEGSIDQNRNLAVKKINELLEEFYSCLHSDNLSLSLLYVLIRLNEMTESIQDEGSLLLITKLLIEKIISNIGHKALFENLAKNPKLHPFFSESEKNALIFLLNSDALTKEFKQALQALESSLNRLISVEQSIVNGPTKTGRGMTMFKMHTTLRDYMIFRDGFIATIKKELLNLGNNRTPEVAKKMIQKVLETAYPVPQTLIDSIIDIFSSPMKQESCEAGSSTSSTFDFG